MAYFLLKLLPPRSSFPFDITDTEREAMLKHSEYWKVLADKGVAIVVGPVFDADGAYGIAVVDIEDESAAHALGENDPAIKSAIGARYSVSPMPSIILGTK